MEKLTKNELKELRKLERIEEEKQQKKQIIIKQIMVWGGIAAVIILSIFGLIKLASTTGDSGSILSSNQINIAPVSDKDIVTGNKDAKVTLIEYSDFQCPACAAYYPFVKQLKSDFNGKILFVYRFFPLTQIHKNAMISSQAAYAAQKQGKFWEMHDLMFDNQIKWSESTNASNIFLSYAKDLNLDIDKFQKDMNSDETKKFVNEQASDGLNAGVNSTPTFFLNGKKILQNPKNYAQFKELVESELNK